MSSARPAPHWSGTAIAISVAVVLIPAVCAASFAGDLPTEVIVATTVAIAGAVLSWHLERLLDPGCSLFTPLSTHAILYPLHFVIPAFTWYYEPRVFRFIRPHILGSTCWIIAIGIALQAVGYLLARLWFLRQGRAQAKAPDPPPTEHHAATFFFLLVGLDVAAKAGRLFYGAYFQTQLTHYGDVPPELWATLIMLSNFGFVAYTFAATQALLADDHRASWAWRSRVTWIYNFLYYLPTGRKESTILLLIFPFLVSALTRKRAAFGRLQIVAAALVTVMVFGVYTVYRTGMESLSRAGSLGSEYDTETVRTIFEAGRSKTPTVEHAADLFETGIMAAMRRTTLTESVYLALENTPDAERLGGESLGWIVSSLIPRALWPEKPNMHLGNEFGHIHRMVEYSDLDTSISVTYLGEFVWNFGSMGVALMLVLGAINGALYSILSDERSVFRITVYSAIWLPIAFVGGEFALFYGGILKLFLVLGVMWKFAGWIGKAKPQGRPLVRPNLVRRT